MLICRILVTETVSTIGNKSYSHFNAWKQGTIRQNTGEEGGIRYVVPNQIIGDMSPAPPISAPMLMCPA